MCTFTEMKHLRVRVRANYYHHFYEKTLMTLKEMYFKKSQKRVASNSQKYGQIERACS